MAEITKSYESRDVEQKWYAAWQQAGCFAGKVTPHAPAYSIAIPPPNVTGVLTMGHVLNNTIQDILIRRARLEGRSAMWLPGTDHAGIATQTVVERQLRKEKKTRHDFGREKFVEKVWEWREEKGGIILEQLRRLGASCDWDRTQFTMDPHYSQAVLGVFVKLFERGNIYRGKRMVNWCPASQTALSDEEVIMKPVNGLIYRVRYELTEAPGTFIEVKTTRPETIPGDVAIAVHPEDARYTALIGKTVWRPLNRAAIPIIADAAVDKEFGSGALKITPAHDKVDFEVGTRHKLPVIDVLNADGSLNALAGPELAGLDRFAGRKKAAEILKESGALLAEEAYANNVGYSERADVPIEPRLTWQWWLRYPRVEEAKTAVRDGHIKFHPERWSKVYLHWLENIQDWCISRQLWWGHRIPVWYRKGVDKESLTEADLRDTAKVHISLAGPADPENWVQEDDVLDTWASSWLWPFATLGWPDKEKMRAAGYDYFYPTSTLVTGPDIIFFWVARMIMAGLEFTHEGEPLENRSPFKNVYFTGIIRDQQGRKMSKSLGNSPDPLDLIAKFGADALRFGVMRSAPLGSDILFDEKNVELGRNFCTKLWNAARFRQMQGGETEADIVPTLLTSDDKWILLRLDTAIAEVSSALAEYRFADAANALYRFFWSEYCDWYVEASKASLGSIPSTESTPSMDKVDDGRRANTLAVMDYVFSHTLRLFHPFMPFITEELWQGMGFAKDMPAKQGGETIMFAPWPKPFTPEEREYFILDESDEQFANAKYEVVNLGRGLRRDFNIASSKRVRFVLKPTATLADHETAVLQLLLNAEPLEVNAAFAPAKGTPVALTPLGELFLPLDGLIDVAAERERIGKEIAKADDELAKVRTKLADPNFAGKVPAKVLEDHQTRERDWAEKHAQLTKMREALGAS